MMDIHEIIDTDVYQSVSGMKYSIESSYLRKNVILKK